MDKIKIQFYAFLKRLAVGKPKSTDWEEFVREDYKDEKLNVACNKLTNAKVNKKSLSKLATDLLKEQSS